MSSTSMNWEPLPQRGRSSRQERRRARLSGDANIPTPMILEQQPSNGTKPREQRNNNHNKMNNISNNSNNASANRKRQSTASPPKNQKRVAAKKEETKLHTNSNHNNHNRRNQNGNSNHNTTTNNNSNPRKRQSTPARSPSKKKKINERTNNNITVTETEPNCWVVETTAEEDKAPETPTPTDPIAEELGRRLQQAPTYLPGTDGKSWIIHVKEWFPSPSQQAFQDEWNLHPDSRHEIKVYGKVCLEKRWSQSWGFSYKYSGNVNPARPLKESTVIPDLLDTINGLWSAGGSNRNRNPPYNGCLQNWYTPNDHIGLHADDEKDLDAGYPIWSLSWGGTRRFLLRPKKSKKGNNNNYNRPVEFLMEDGDLILMGGTCQETHKHEVPKVRKSMDPPTSDRINYTIRAFRS